MEFTKMVASGNDFVLLVEEELDRPITSEDVVRLCTPKYGVGADGVLLLSFLGEDRVRMRIVNSDGSEAEMCGNGARCAVRFASERLGKEFILLETLAGEVLGWYFPESKRAKVRLTRPKDLARGILLDCSWGKCTVDYVDTGVPHTILFVDDIDNIDVFGMGREIRYHGYFAPKGTNVDFVKVLDKDKIRIRTYERGVENETLACGTGSVASALLSLMAMGVKESSRVDVQTQGGEVLGVEVKFSDKGEVEEVFLEGDVRKVFSGRVLEVF